MSCVWAFTPSRILFFAQTQSCSHVGSRSICEPSIGSEAEAYLQILFPFNMR